MPLKDKLFPRKGKDRDVLVVKAKSHIRRLALVGRNYNKKASISRQNAKIALKRGEKARAKNYLIMYKQYQLKVDRATNMRTKIERQIEAIKEGTLIQQTGGIVGGIRDELKEIAAKASPVKIAEITEDSEAYVAEIEEAGDILAGDPEIDFGISVDDELNQLESEILLDATGTMPAVPADNLEYITDVDIEVEDTEIKSKEKLQAEIEKLRKELDS